MTSKEALDWLVNYLVPFHFHANEENRKKIDNLLSLLKQDLERLEVLEKENKELKEENNELVNESTYYQVLKDKYEEDSAIIYEKNVKIKNIFMQFSKWLNNEIDEKDKILKSKKGTYTHIVELSTLIFVLDKLKEVLGNDIK